jgi:hypothetical protein
MTYLSPLFFRCCFLAVILGAFSSIQAQTPTSTEKRLIKTPRIFVGLGSQGLLLGSAFQMSKSFDARVVYSSTNLNKTGNNSSSVTSSFDLKMENLSVLADWFPSEKSGFRISTGVQTGTNKITFTARPSGSVTIGDSTYNNVKLSASMDLGNTAPYVGIGYSTRSDKDAGFTFFNDLGVRVVNPKVNISESTGIVSKTDIDKEKIKIEDKLKVLKYYPVVNLGVGYRW